MAAKKITEEKAPLDSNDHASMRPQSSVETHVIGVVQSAGKCKRCAAKCGKIWLGCQVPILYKNIMHFRTIYKWVQRVILDCFSFLYCTLLLAKKLAPLSRPIGSLRYFSFSAIGPCHYFDFGFTTLNLKALKISILISSLRCFLFIWLVMVIISISVTTSLNRKALKKKEKKNLSTVSVVITSGPIDSKLFMSSFTGPVYTTWSCLVDLEMIQEIHKQTSTLIK